MVVSKYMVEKLPSKKAFLSLYHLLQTYTDYYKREDTFSYNVFKSLVWQGKKTISSQESISDWKHFFILFLFVLVCPMSLPTSILQFLGTHIQPSVLLTCPV